MTAVEHRNPQDAYTVLHNPLQQEWDFVLCATQILGEDLALVDKYLCEAFSLDLLHGVYATTTVWATMTPPPLNRLGYSSCKPPRHPRGTGLHHV